MSITYKVQPFHVRIQFRTVRLGEIDDAHASFSDEGWARDWAPQFTKDALVKRIDIEEVRAGSRTPLRSWTPEDGWQTLALSHFPS